MYTCVWLVLQCARHTALAVLKKALPSVTQTSAVTQPSTIKTILSAKARYSDNLAML